MHFLDLKRDVVEREIERMTAGHRHGPHAENILRDLGVVAARSH
jgi:pyruvate ferredoxin oxidoreductase alpha subunit